VQNKQIEKKRSFSFVSFKFLSSEPLHPQFPEFVFFQSGIWASFHLNNHGAQHGRIGAPQSSPSSASFMLSGKARPKSAFNVSHVILQ
jgi:hypothetical protein